MATRLVDTFVGVGVQHVPPPDLLFGVDEMVVIDERGFDVWLPTVSRRAVVISSSRDLQTTDGGILAACQHADADRRIIVPQSELNSHLLSGVYM